MFKQSIYKGENSCLRSRKQNARTLTHARVSVRKHFTYLESGLEDQTEVWPACLVALSQQYVLEQCQELLFSSVVPAELAAAVAVAAAAAVVVVAAAAVVVVVVVVVVAVAAVVAAVAAAAVVVVLVVVVAPCAFVSFPLQGENEFFRKKCAT